MPAALLIGPITHARQEWEGLSSLLSLKVECAADIRDPSTMQEDHARTDGNNE